MKSSSLMLSTYHFFLRPKWVTLGFFVPLLIYGLFLFLDDEILAFSLPYFPDEPDKSIGFYRDLLHLAFGEMLWYTGFFLAAWIIWKYTSPARIPAVASPVISFRKNYPALIILVSFVITVGVSFYTLDTFPNSSDEYV